MGGDVWFVVVLFGGCDSLLIIWCKNKKIVFVLFFLKKGERMLLIVKYKEESVFVW